MDRAMTDEKLESMRQRLLDFAVFAQILTN